MTRKPTKNILKLTLAERCSMGMVGRDTGEHDTSAHADHKAAETVFMAFRERKFEAVAYEIFELQIPECGWKIFACTPWSSE